MALAIIRKKTGEVVTFVRDDVPDGWTPPEGCAAIPESKLPSGWTREIAVDTPETIERRAVEVLRDKLDADQTLTAAEQRRALKFLLKRADNV